MANFIDAIRPFSKLIAAIVGVTIFVVFKHYGITLPGLDGLVFDLLSGALIVGGAVYQSPANTPSSKRSGK